MSKEQDIVEGKSTFIRMNMMIADFMGAVHLPNGWVAIERREYAYQTKHYPGNLRYDSSWGWLMPVVEKISEMDNQADVSFYMKNGYNQRMDLDIFKTSILCHMEVVYKRVIQFIQWYQQNQKPQ